MLYKTNSIYLVLGLIIVSTGLVWDRISTTKTCDTPRPLVAFLDIGQGDAIYIQDSLGKSMLIDTGPKDSPVLTQIQKVTGCPKVHIDHLLLTHPDADHIGEAERLIEKGVVTEMLHNGFVDVDQKDESATENRLEEVSVKRRMVKIGDVVSLENIDLEILFPGENLYLATSSEPKGRKN